MIYLIGFVLVVLIIVGVSIFIGNKKRENAFEEESENMEIVVNLFEEIQEGLTRFYEIAKTSDSKKLYESSLGSSIKLEKSYRSYIRNVEELEELNSIKKNKRFTAHLITMQDSFFDLEENLMKLNRNIKKFNTIEVNNTEIAIQLKALLKDLNNKFDINLKAHSVYNDGFNSLIADAQSEIIRFEELHRIGEYPKGHMVLTKTGEIVSILETMTNTLIAQYSAVSEIELALKNNGLVTSEIEILGYKLHIENQEQVIEEAKNRKNSIVSKLEQVNYLGDDTQEQFAQINKEIELLSQFSEKFNDEVQKQFSIIKELILIEETNGKTIEVLNEVLELALIDIEKIKEIYSIGETTQMTKIEERQKELKIFLTDYNKLLELIHEAKEDHETLKNRAQQSSQYLNKLTTNIKKDILKLKAIRQDEFDARNIVESVEKDIIELDLYLCRNNHQNKLTNNISNLFVELNNQKNELSEELAKEKIDISAVRSISNYLENNIEDFKTTKLTNNIKQRLISIAVIEYISRFNKNQSMATNIQMLNNYYAANQYNPLLTEAHKTLIKLTPEKGDLIYRKIVSSIKVDPFESVLTVIGEKDEL